MRKKKVDVVPVSDEFEINWFPDRNKKITVSVVYYGSYMAFRSSEFIQTTQIKSIAYLKNIDKYILTDIFVLCHYEEFLNQMDLFLRKVIEKNPWLKIDIYEEFSCYRIESFIENGISWRNYFLIKKPLPETYSFPGEEAWPRYDLGDYILVSQCHIKRKYLKHIVKSIQRNDKFFIHVIYGKDKLFIKDFVSGIVAKILKESVVINENLRYAPCNMRTYYRHISSYAYINDKGEYLLHKILEKWTGGEK